MNSEKKTKNLNSYFKKLMDPYKLRNIYKCYFRLKDESKG